MNYAHEHSSLSVSSSIKDETNTHENSSLSVLRSLKNETEPPQIESSLSLDLANVESSLSLDLVNIESSLLVDLINVELSLSLDLVIEPSFLSSVSVDPLSSSPSGEPFPICNQKFDWVSKKSRWMKQSLGGMSPTFGNHARVKLLAYVGHARGKLPTSRHHVGKKTH